MWGLNHTIEAGQTTEPGFDGIFYRVYNYKSQPIQVGFFLFVARVLTLT